MDWAVEAGPFRALSFTFRVRCSDPAVGNYLACNLETRSELVVLIRRGSAILGQIDIDSDVTGPFAEDEVAAVRRVAEALAVLL